MEICVRAYTQADVAAMVDIWNEIVDEGISFPQKQGLSLDEGAAFFASQTHCGVAVDSDSGEVVGLYILHPNNVGRCGHISNASYAVKSSMRGRHIGEKLVLDCLSEGKKAGFRILQFNAVVKTNYGARHLYEKLGFVPLGTIPGGFLMKDGRYEDIVVYYHTL